MFSQLKKDFHFFCSEFVRSFPHFPLLLGAPGSISFFPHDQKTEDEWRAETNREEKRPKSETNEGYLTKSQQLKGERIKVNKGNNNRIRSVVSVQTQTPGEKIKYFSFGQGLKYRRENKSIWQKFTQTDSHCITESSAFVCNVPIR